MQDDIKLKGGPTSLHDTLGGGENVAPVPIEDQMKVEQFKPEGVKKKFKEINTKDK